MGTNAAQFSAELKAEVQKVEKDFVAFRADVVGDMLSVAAGLSPVGKTKTLVKSWGANTGRHRVMENWNGSASARQRILLAKPGSTIWAGNAWFVSGFFEKGTKRGIRARHMLARGIESVKERHA